MNHLSNEKSPYLLQHADNPVDWYPWGEEAFEKAKKEDKPVFLSIGYSTCHWCHVMERESFEDGEVAGLMNDAFVSIKVDREERPDIDGIYMTVCQMLTGSGGWPLTIIMTPDKEPFFAGTYFPKTSRFGKPGMKELIPQLKEFWLHKREEVNRSAAEIVSEIKRSEISSVNELDKNNFEKAFNEFRNRFDPQYGGFGTAPKFPSPHNLFFLLRYYKKSGNTEALEMVEKTLSEMRKGGIFDHIGYGFHRYSTDREWLIPHFEKMLYDQALLTMAYTETYQITGKQIYKQTAEEILEYIQREMTSPDGGFYSAEDADSEGEEGKFYLWTIEEIKNILGEDAPLISKIFNLQDNGNLPGEGSGYNILHLIKTLQDFSKENGYDEDFIIGKLRNAREKLFENRNQRIHPFKDNKILTDWNGLMISAYAKAAQVFQSKNYEKTAVRTAEFVLRKLRDPGGKLLHRYREGEAGIPANLDDYSFFVNGLIDLYEATFNISWLETAIELNEDMIKHFWDDRNGGFFFSPDYGEKLIVRQKEIYDGAIPSGNSVAVLNLLKLGRITGHSSLEEKAYQIANVFSNQLNRTPSAFSQTLTSLDFGYNGSFEIVIAGKQGENTTEEIIEYFRKEFLANKIILLKEQSDKDLKRIAPFTEFQNQLENKTTIYICRNYICDRPVTSLEDVKQILK